MNDTPKHILQKQYEIIAKLPLHERLIQVFDLTELSREMIKDRIKAENPMISEADLHIELFKVFYRNDFDTETLNQITGEMKKFLNRKYTPDSEH